MFLILLNLISFAFSLDISLGLMSEKSYYFGLKENNINSYAFIAEMKKNYNLGHDYYASFGGAYTYHSVNNSFKDTNFSLRKDDAVYERLGLTTVNLMTEFGKYFYKKNMLSVSFYFGIATASYNGIIDNGLYKRRDEGYTYAMNLFMGRFLNKNLIAKLGLMYRGVDNTSPQSFDFLSTVLLFEYRI